MQRRTLFSDTRAKSLAASVLAASVLATGGLSACKDSPNAPKASDKSAANGEPAAAAAVLAVGMPNGPQTENHNPFLTTSAAASLGYRWMMYEPLMMWNPVKPAEPSKPWLAASVKWSPDFKSATIEVRDNAKWSDGKPVSGEDVAYTFQLIKDHEALNLQAIPYGDIAASGNTVTVSFDSSMFVYKDKWLGQTPIVPKHIWETVENPATHTNKAPVGSGPYTLKSFTPQTTTLTLRSDGGYWQDLPAVEELRYTSYLDNNAQTTALSDGSSEWSFVFIPNYKTVFVDKDPEHYHVWAPPVLGIHGLYINTTKPPFDDVALRKAMNLVINREDIFYQAEAGYFHPLVTNVSGLPSPAGDAFIAEAYENQEHSVDVEGAKKLLAEAGYKLEGETLKDPNGKPVTLTLTDPAGWSDYQTSLEIVKDNLSEIGIAATVEKANHDAWFRNVEEGNFDATFRWTNSGSTPYDIYHTVMDGALLKPVGTASPGGNFGRFDSPEATAALREYADGNDDAARSAALATLQRVFVEQVPMIPVGADNIGMAYSTKNWVGWPDETNPYTAGQPTQPNALDVVLHLEPAGS
ncbi:ABC transporter substrate-binding protein [Haliangium ochraceum]|uniref:Extracellular solute-binding protein family 5 n=1 Tax=Haliangium ochraceum (strain DSM 14365 / JCM 11303 / SMP-2) TaxID=502025 RepID=D0LVQ4_HALO1|nr:ABC transporter substrate-binding protein [Haliangium ochraceum]ACY14038.1 extracellular solute-binding protein family 5 [Haliangium ochraceum DSM 14365]